MHDFLDELENEKGYLYYVNKSTGQKHKEHPKLIRILNEIKEKYSKIKFVTYRSAKKLIHLQKCLYTYYIPFKSVISTVLERHRLQQSDDAPLLRPTVLTAILHDIFYAAEKMGLFLECENFQLKTACSVLANLFWNVFDTKRSTSISLMELKLTLLILCELPVSYQDIINEHFQLTKDHNNCVTRSRMESIITIFTKLLSYLDETLYFDRKTTQEILNESFDQCQFISQFQFVNLWIADANSKFSQYSNLFVLLIRLKKAEHVVHNVRCTGTDCESFPVKGLLFKCQKCKNLVLCFNCFTRGYTGNKSHTLAHRMFELSSVEVAEPRKLGILLLKICNVFKRSSTGSTMVTSLDEQENTHKMIDNVELIMKLEDDVVEEYKNTLKKTNSKYRTAVKSEIFNNSENMLITQRNLMDKLLEVVETLTTENFIFEKKVNEHAPMDPEIKMFMEGHKKFISEQVGQLKYIWDTMPSLAGNKPTKNDLVSSPATTTCTSILNLLPHSSTPYRPHKPKPVISSPLDKSIHGAEVNKTYLEQNKCDYSVSDISCWFQTKNQKNPAETAKNIDDMIRTFDDVAIETKMTNFRDLLLKVKEIIDDSYSENTELAKTTQEMEHFLEQMIGAEEHKRK